MKHFHVIMILIWLGFLAGCRASKESKARSERTAESEIGVELRKADSLWSSIAERLTMKIEFYPQLGDFGTSGHGTEGPQTIIQKSLGIGTSLPAAPLWPVPAGVANPLPWQAQGVGAGGMGAALRQAQGPVNPPDPLCKGGIKSIEISIEKTEDRSVITATDSVLEQKTATTETRQEEKASEARHDNGTVLIVSVAAAVAFLLALLIIIKKTLHK